MRRETVAWARVEAVCVRGVCGGVWGGECEQGLRHTDTTETVQAGWL